MTKKEHVLSSGRPCDRIKIALNVDVKYWVGFNNIPDIGRVRLGQLESYFGGLEQAWKASQGELRKAGLDSVALRTIGEWRDTIDPEAQMARLEQQGIQVITSIDKAYPRRLKEIYDFPPVLYVKGALKPEDEWCLAVVGTRRATVYGKQVTEEITADLARSKITIVSGLAKGIDTVAHRSALEAGGGGAAGVAPALQMIYPAGGAQTA